LRGPRGGAILCREEYAKKIDMAVFPGQQGGPLEHSIAAKAVAFKEASLPGFSTYTNQIVLNARAFGAALAGEGFRLVSGGTENHMLLLDLREFDEGLTGKVAQEVLDRAGITTNRNQIPDDPRSPFITSGLRVGTAAETTAGMKESEFAAVAIFMARALRQRDDDAAIANVRDEVASLCAQFNPYATFSK
jgi:glycine hydroxymethyltransferase